MSRFNRTGVPQKPAAALFLQTIAVTPDGDDVAVVQQAVENGSGHQGITEYRSPFAHTSIASDQHSATLIATADKLEEQMCGPPPPGGR
jgi:hypothetical protein